MDTAVWPRILWSQKVHSKSLPYNYDNVGINYKETKTHRRFELSLSLCINRNKINLRLTQTHTHQPKEGQTNIWSKNSTITLKIPTVQMTKSPCKVSVKELVLTEKYQKKTTFEIWKCGLSLKAPTHEPPLSDHSIAFHLTRSAEKVHWT